MKREGIAITQINLVLDAFGAIVTAILLFSCVRKNVRRKSDNIYFTKMLFALLVILLTDFFDWLKNGVVSYRVPLYLSNSLNYIAGYVIVLFFLRYLAQFMEKQDKFKSVIRIFDVFGLISVLLVGVNFFNGMYFTFDLSGIYRRQQLYWLSQFYPLMALVAIAVLICFWPGLKRRERIVFSSYSFFPMVGIVVDFMWDGMTLTYTGAVISALVIFIEIDAMQSQKLARQENELIQAKVKIMLSQIQPHFLYNALLVIQNLCHEKAPEAEKVTIEFSQFLRGNLDSLSLERPILFEQEMNHVKHYLTLEKYRFGERLRVKYDIKAMQFRVPALTLQPLVENAVRYGIMKKEEGGTISISTRETESFYMITVQDDGVGFDIKNIKNDGRSHIGILNVRERLRLQIGGTLEIVSREGVGTTVTIQIMKGTEDENTGNR